MKDTKNIIIRKPRLTQKRIQGLWMCIQLAKCDSEMMNQEEANAHGIDEAYEYVKGLRKWWQAKHEKDLFHIDLLRKDRGE